jgi:high-affinity Fe2+/Pb2+ permease
MLSVLQQPYVFAVAVAVLTAALVYFYSRTIESDQKSSNKTFFKTLAAGLLVGGGLAYLSQPKPEALATEPFMDASPGI